MDVIKKSILGAEVMMDNFEMKLTQILFVIICTCHNIEPVAF